MTRQPALRLTPAEARAPRPIDRLDADDWTHIATLAAAIADRPSLHRRVGAALDEADRILDDSGA